ncbi:hypothetical protein V8B97DRAFT_2008886 [Scleroderma yunnanense]
MNRTSEGISTAKSIDEHESDTKNQLCVWARRRRGKLLRSGPYPKWTFDEGDTHVLLDRLALVQASLRCRSRPRPQLSPIARLPSELLALIFLRAIEAPAQNNVLPSQLVISSVCKAWRSVAFSTPEYWGTLYVSPKMPMSVYHFFLEKSSPFPLSVEFFLWRPFKRKQYVSSNEPILERLLDMLKPETNRLRSLTIQRSNCSWSAEGMVRSWIGEYFIYPP